MERKKYRLIIGALLILQVISLITIVIQVNQNSSLQSELAKSINVPPKIEGIEFLDMNNQNVYDGIWATVPPDGKLKIRFKIQGHYSSIDMFITPVGSQMYLEQKIINTIGFYAIDKASPPETEYVWNVPKGTLGHFQIIVYEGMIGTKSDLYGVKYE